MLASEMIRKMARSYTDQQVYRQSDKAIYGSGWWSNGFMVLFEDLPEVFGPEIDNIAESSDADDLKTWGWAQATGPQVWPVMLKPIYDSNWVEVMFTDGQDLKIWANAHYISAILKRDACVDWHSTSEGQLKASNGKPVAILMPMVHHDKDYDKIDHMHSSEWAISNFDLVASRYLKIARQVDALLPKGKKGQDWQEIILNGKTVQAMRHITPGLTWMEGVVKRHDTGMGDGTMTENFCPCRNVRRRHTKKKIEICIRSNGNLAEIDLYDGYTRLGVSNE